MKTFASALLAASTLLGAALPLAMAGATCTVPQAPESLPDGSKAAMEEMLAAKTAVAKYNDDTTAYLSCIKLEYDAALAAMEQEGQSKTSAADKKALAQMKQQSEVKQTQKHNAAVDAVTAVVDRFNVELRAFNKKKKEG